MSQWPLLPFALAALLAAPAPALAAPPPGTLYILEGRVDPGSESFEKDVKAAARSALGKNGGDSWHLSFVAYLRKPPGSDDVNLVFYEGPPVPGKEINAYPIHTKATAKILMAEVDVKPEDGFKEGHKYQVLVTRLIGGHEEIYARTTLELK